MKYYLSSFKLGDESHKLQEMASGMSGNFAYISNALDSVNANAERKAKHISDDIEEVENLGLRIEKLDLKDYFGKKEELRNKLNSLAGVYVSGGNTFILRQAYKLSGFDDLLIEMQDRGDFIYAGYSAAVCVVTPTLEPYAITDNAKDFPYKEIAETIWDGVGLLNFIFEPHYDSGHSESASTDIEIDYCIKNKLLFKAYKDGEVLVIE